MTSRQIRRAEERRAQKLARKAAVAAAPVSAEQLAAAQPDTDLAQRDTDLAQPDAGDNLDLAPESIHEVATISDAQLAANRANSQLSTGPTSPEGKSKVSLNAVKTALTGRTVLLCTDDAAEYERFLRAYEKEFKPFTQRECDLVQSIADTMWRLRRIPGLEMGIFAKGRIELANAFADRDSAERASLIEVEIHLKYEKQLRNLQLQEARLRRRYEKETAELRQLQQERKQREKRELDTAAKLYLAAKHDGKPFHPADNGFDFPLSDVLAYLEGVRAANIYENTLKQERTHAAAA